MNDLKAGFSKLGKRDLEEDWPDEFVKEETEEDQEDGVVDELDQTIVSPPSSRAPKKAGATVLESSLELLDELLEENKTVEAIEELAELKESMGAVEEGSMLEKRFLFYEGALKRQTREYEVGEAILHKLLKQDFTHGGRVQVELARISIRLGKHKRAKKLLEDALKLNPDKVGWKLIYANVHEHLRNREGALKVYNEILEMDGNDSKTLFRLGDLFYSQNKLLSAVKYYDEAILLDPSNEVIWNNKGFAYLHALELLEEAIECYDRALEINPNDEVSWNNRGNALYNIGRRTRDKRRFRGALKYFMKAVEVNPDYEIAWNNIGNTLYYLGRYEESLEYHDKALDIKPDFYYAFHAKAESYHHMGRLYDALEYIDIAIELNPRYAASYTEKGVILADMGRFDEANKYFDLGIIRQPAEGRLWIVYGQFYDRIGEHEKALKIYDEGARLYDRVARQSQREEHWTNKARMLMDIGFFDNAMQDLDRALVIDPDHLEALLLKADLLEKLGKKEEALATIEDCVQANPQEVIPWVSRGVLLRNGDRYQEAEESFLRAVEVQKKRKKEDGESASPFVELADLYFLTREWEKLEKAAEEGLRIAENVNPRIWFCKGLMEKTRENYALAVEHISKAIEQDFWETDYYLHRGECLFNAEKYSKAITDFEQVLGNDPAHYMALYYKGMALYKSGKLATAERLFAEACKLDEELPFAWDGRAKLAERLGKGELAMKYRVKAEVYSEDLLEKG